MFGNVLSLLGAMPAERRISHAFPRIPALANEIADLWFFTKGLSTVQV